MITDDISIAVNQLRLGAIVAIPTETVYGLAAVAYDESAIKAVFKAKNRPFFDPLIVHIGRWEQLEDIAEPLTPVEAHLLKTFWPGPLTLVKKKKASISDLITSGYQSVAVRMPAHKIALELLNRLGQPVVAPSANQFGKTSATTAEHVQAEFSADLTILDGASCEIGIESTIISCSDTEVVVHRPGGVSREKLRGALDNGKFYHEISASQNNATPGQLKHHYQPTKPLYVYQVTSELELVLQESGLSLKESYLIEMPVDASLAARTLYSNLRLGDSSEAKAIILKWNAPMTGDWEGIWDRVQRAATFVFRQAP